MSDVPPPPPSPPASRRTKKRLLKSDQQDQNPTHVSDSLLNVPPVDASSLLPPSAPVASLLQSCDPHSLLRKVVQPPRQGTFSANLAVQPKSQNRPSECRTQFNAKIDSTTLNQDLPSTSTAEPPPLIADVEMDPLTIFPEPLCLSSRVGMDANLLSFGENNPISHIRPISNENFKIDWHCFLSNTGQPLAELIEGASLGDVTVDESEETAAEDPAPAPEVKNPLYAGSPLSLQECLITILAYAQSVHMSGQDFSKLLQLLNILLPQPNNLPKSSHQFFKCFDKDETELQIFYFCTCCWKQRASLSDICPDCKDPKKKVTYYLICPILPQLEKMYSRPGFVEKLNYKNVRQKIDENNLEDVYDSSVYRNAEQTVFKDSNSISLTWYTDGISIFECSTYTLWPFLFVINELPPEERFKPENVILGGLWGCNEKPHPNVFLLPLYCQLMSLSEGCKVKAFNSEVEMEVHVFLLFGTCDVPAKASFMNMKGHSGYFSCPKCLVKGEKSPRTGNVMVFLHEDNLEPRTDENYKEFVSESVKIKDDYKGVFGPSILSFMTASSFISSVSIDSMHCVQLGVTKQLINLWFNPTFSSEKFSLSQKTEIVNRRLLSLKLPHFVQRSPVGVDKLSYWKATLLRNFLLYFALVVMKGVMQLEYFDHLSLLVEAISLLNSPSISDLDIQKADELLCQFTSDFQKLYGMRHMSSNMHLLRHLPQSVAETGNLFVTSCFRFEDLNGKLARLIHGTTHATMQIFCRYSILTNLEKWVSSITSLSLRSFCDKLSHGSNLNITEKICVGTYIVGMLAFNVHFEYHIRNILSSMYAEPPKFQTFDRLYQNRMLYVSASYTKGTKNSSFCRYYGHTEMLHGKILCFVKTSDNSFYALISRIAHEPTDIKRYYAAGIEMAKDLVPITCLINVAFCLEVDNFLYIIDPANSFELE
ncbi:65-kDa microtubule-associated protein 2 [Frankliniella fusca]|uniref:65-kDa microtubule-associated protein 2 n=1 Tax=Frankliniella fusca TaxID=407009 RepID=A0AAE1HAX0_9NEOP|nr:65-kDa microtubule-associated protein 2 [Frankliniella fusca]